MRVLICTAVFPPEPLTTASTSADLASELAARGHEVVVLAPFPNRPEGRLFTGYRRAWRTMERRESYGVVHTWHLLSSASRPLSRALEQLSFAFSSTAAIFAQARPDVAYLNTWPLLVQNSHAFALAFKKTAVVASIQDVYPETLITKGILEKGSLRERVLHQMDAAFLRHCSKVVTISASMQRYLVSSRGLFADHVACIPNWVDETPFNDVAPPAVLRERYGLASDAFVCTFAGAITGSVGAELYLATAARLRSESKIVLMLAGDGSERESLETQARDRGLSNVRFFHPLTPREVPSIQGASDVLLLSLAGGSATFAAPSKQVSYMFSGKPIVANVAFGSPAAEILSESAGGVVLAPQDADALADTLIRLARSPEECAKMGSMARDYARLHFSKQALVSRLADLIESSCHDPT